MQTARINCANEAVASSLTEMIGGHFQMQAPSRRRTMLFAGTGTSSAPSSPARGKHRRRSDAVPSSLPSRGGGSNDRDLELASAERSDVPASAPMAVISEEITTGDQKGGVLELK